MVRMTEVQSQVELYQRLKKWYLILPCLTLSIIRFMEVPVVYGGAHGVMVIVPAYEHGDTSSIPGQDWLHFT